MDLSNVSEEKIFELCFTALLSVLCAYEARFFADTIAISVIQC